MELLNAILLVSVGVLLLHAAYSTLSHQAIVRHLERIAPGENGFLCFKAALAEPNLTKADIHEAIYADTQADTSLKVTHADITAVLQSLSTLYQDMTEEQAIAQVRAMRSW